MSKHIESGKQIIGAKSGLPLPTIDLSHIKEQPYFLQPQFIKLLLTQIPAKEKQADAVPFSTTKQREASLIRILKKGVIPGNSHNGKCKDFWKNFRKTNPHFKEHEVNSIQKACMRAILSRHRQIIKDNHGLSTYGLLLKSEQHSGRLSLEPGVEKILPSPKLDFVPPVDVATLSQPTLKKLQDLEDRLLARIRGGAAAAQKLDKRDSNRGVSLTRTVVTGGAYSNKTRGISGSIHTNGNLRPRQSRPKTPSLQVRYDQEVAAADQLQDEVFSVVSEVILEAFGNKFWYKACMQKLQDIPRERLIPGGKVPASNIWFTSDPKAFHIHTDTNTVPPAFVFCARTVRGGDLIVQTPTGPTKLSTTAGKVIGGSWAQYPHCNFPVHKNDNRHSFVVYLDHRMLSSSYNYHE